MTNIGTELNQSVTCNLCSCRLICSWGGLGRTNSLSEDSCGDSMTLEEYTSTGGKS